MDKGFKCETHPNFDITHICCTPSCFVFLCALCIPDHCAKHMKMQVHTEIQLLENVSLECKEIINKSINKLNDELAIKTAILSEKEETNFLALRRIKEELLQELNKFFLFQEAQLREHYDNNRNLKELRSMKEKLQINYEKICTPRDSRLIEAILKGDIDLEFPSKKEFEEKGEDEILVVEEDKPYSKDFQSFLSSSLSIIKSIKSRAKAKLEKSIIFLFKV